MAQIRVVGVLQMKDRETAEPLLRRISEVASNVAGVEIWEVFSDPESGLVYLNERFESEEAFLNYERAVTEQGLRPQVRKSIEMSQLLLLSPLGSEHLKTELDAIGAIEVRLLAASDQTPTE